MSQTVTGLVCLALFAISQGVRDAYFGHLFQSVSFLLVATLAFALSCCTFTAIALCRDRRSFCLLLSAPASLLSLNATTAAAWLTFLYGLHHLEPAVVAMLYNGMGPLTALVMARVGTNVISAPTSRAELMCYLALTATLLASVIVVLSDHSAMGVSSITTAAVALMACAFGGVMITLSYAVTRRFTDLGAPEEAVMGVRFVLTLLVAATMEATLMDGALRPELTDLVPLGMSAFALIIIPSFLVQLGVSRTTALAANVFRALGPVCVFLVQQLDDRLRYSPATLGCIITFCIATVAASGIRAQAEIRDAAARRAASSLHTKR